jgi:hypothetical protein
MIAEIVSLPGYETQVSALLSEDKRMALEFFIACDPEAHPVIPGAGGFRSSPGAEGQRKERRLSGDLFFLARPGQIYMAAIYAGSRRENLSTGDQNTLAKVASQIKKAVRGEQ